MKATHVVSALAAVGIVGLGALGISGAQQKAQLEQHLEPQIQMAQTLHQLSEHKDLLAKDLTGGQESAQKLQELIDRSLEQLPQAAQERATTDERDQEVDQGNSAQQSFQNSIDTLLQIVMAQENAVTENPSAVRLEGIRLAFDLASFAQDHGIDVNPTAALEPMPPQNTCDTSNTSKAPETVQALLATLNAELYVQQISGARKAESTNSETLRKLTHWKNELNDAASCSYTPVRQLPAYDTSQESSTQFTDMLNTNLEAVIADPDISSESALLHQVIRLCAEQKLSS